MAGKTAEEIKNMTDEELVAAADAGELGDNDGSNPNQRDPEADEEEGEDEGEDEGEEAEEEEDDNTDSEAAEDDGEIIELGGKKYTKDEYAALVADLESSERAVPLSALKRQTEKTREAEERLRQLELKNARLEGAQEQLDKAQKQADDAAKVEAEARKYDFDAAEENYATLVEKGDKPAAAALRREIRAKEQELSEAKATKREAEAEVRTTQRLQQIEVRRTAEAAANAMYNKYPFLNSESKDADETAILAVVALRDKYITQDGMAAADAIRAACTKIGDAELKRNPRPKNKVDVKELIKRRAAAIRKGVKTNNGQPPRSTAAGISNRQKGSTLTVKDIRNMSDEDFAKLDADELASIDGRSSKQRERG